MREDFRPQDSFSWVRPWVPYGDDPFVWYDPSEDLKPLAPPAAESRPEPRPAPARSPAPVASGQQEDVDIWVELPAAEDKPKRARRSRGRGRDRDRDRSEAPVEGVVEALAPPQVEPEAVVETVEPEVVIEQVAPVEDAPAAKPKRSRAKKVVAPEVEAVVPEPEPTPEPVATAPEPEPEPVPREPDPNEISGPASAPRKGWWRRG